MEATLDETDLDILRALEDDARLSFRNIAENLDISEGTVRNRVQKMLDAGVIKRFSAIVDPTKLGLDIAAVISLRVRGGHLTEVEEEIAHLPNVCSVYDVTGDFDAVVFARFKDRAELNKFIKGILSNEFVERSNTHLVLNTVKEDLRALM